MQKIKIAIIFCISIIIGFVGYSQSPVHWSYGIRKISAIDYQVRFVATIDKDWHIYAQQQPKEAVSVPTKITFYKNPLVVLEGIPKEIGKKETYQDKVVGIVQYYYSDSVVFVQTINMKAAVKTNLAGTVTFQACTNEMCLKEQKENFSLTVN